MSNSSSLCTFSVCSNIITAPCPENSKKLINKMKQTNYLRKIFIETKLTIIVKNNDNNVDLREHIMMLIIKQHTTALPTYPNLLSIQEEIFFNLNYKPLQSTTTHTNTQHHHFIQSTCHQPLPSTQMVVHQPLNLITNQSFIDRFMF